MSLERVKEYLKKFNLENRVVEFNVSSATVALAAEAIGTIPAKIAKSLSFMLDDGAIIIVCAGDVKIDNAKFKEVFKQKAKMLSFDEVERCIGHKVGGVCPFAINDDVRVYLDVSLKNYDEVYPACGSSNSAIKLSVSELQNASQNFVSFVDVCKRVEN